MLFLLDKNNDVFRIPLNKKTDIQVSVCPIVSITELEELPTEYTTSKDQKQQLVEIAKERGDKFKRKVIDKGIDPARILLCTPEIDSNQKGQPRISFSV